MIEHAQCPSVVSIPWLHNIRVSLLKVFDQSNYFHPVGNHIQRVSLHHTLPRKYYPYRPIFSGLERSGDNISLEQNQLHTAINGGPHTIFRFDSSR